MMTSDSSIKWIENLAEQELLISTGQSASLDLTRTKEEVIAVATTAFFRQLHNQFEYLIKLFNTHVSETALAIRVIQEGERWDHFVICRNHTRMSVLGGKPGFIHLQCEKQVGLQPSVMFSGIIEASFAAFDDLEWNFLGSPVTAEQVARHYLTEFIQTSRSDYHLS